MGSRLLREIAKEVLGEERARSIWSRIDVIGDIAVIKRPLRDAPSLEEYRLIAEKILERMPYIRSVWLQTGSVEGDFRLRGGLVHLAGERRTVTIYREHGCSFKVDIARVFVTPRLNYEHLRVARLVRPGEAVLNMFAGAGILSIVIAKLAKPSIVYSIDINPAAYELMKENVKLNRVEDVVKPLLGDAAEVVYRGLRKSSDRVLMPLPALALKYMDAALAALRGGRGWLHVYLHVERVKGSGHLEKAVSAVKARVEELGWGLAAARARVVRSVGPRLVQVVVDAEVEEAGH